MNPPTERPLQGLRVIEMTHMVMGPAAGLVLADMGADVVKIEPVGGDKTRNLPGSGAGYFPMYNRNKRSLAIDIKSTEGFAAVMQLIRQADVMIENFRPGAMRKLGLDYASLRSENPRLIYCALKGFLPGPYDKRTALDEMAQMMGGLAYMTGPPGRPLRAGASVIDVMGGVFGATGILAALERRHRSGEGGEVSSSLFESAVFLVGQHMAQFAVTGNPAPPMPVRLSAWAIYDSFSTRDNEQVFVGVVSDSQWQAFCHNFELSDFANDETLATNSERVHRRDEIIPVVRELFATMDKAELIAKLENIGLPFAPISKPEDLFEDPHLSSNGQLIEVSLPNGSHARLPALPLNMDQQSFGIHRDLPTPGQHSAEVLREAGLQDAAIEQMITAGTVRGG